MLGQRRAAEHVLLVDTGDALVGGGVLGDKTKGEVVVAGMNLMGYDAMALGLKELSLGPDLLAERIVEGRYAVLSANVARQGSTGLFAQPYTVVEVGGHRVGLIGLTAMPPNPVPGFQVRDPVAAAAELVPKVRAEAGTVIVLASVTYRQALELASKVQGIDLLISGAPDQLPTQVARAPGTGTLVITAEQPLPRHSGRRVGKLLVVVGPDGALTDLSWQSVPMTRDIPDSAAMKGLLDRAMASP